MKNSMTYTDAKIVLGMEGYHEVMDNFDRLGVDPMGLFTKPGESGKNFGVKLLLLNSQHEVLRMLTAENAEMKIFL